jgi:lysozyme
MLVDAAGRAFISHEEGEVLHTYRDCGGVLTIGVGHTGVDATPGKVITHELSQILLTKDLAHCEAALNRLVKVPLTQSQFNACASFCFNLGTGAFQKSSLLRLINARTTDRALLTHAFAIWQNVNGQPNKDIHARRLREAALFLTK